MTGALLFAATGVLLQLALWAAQLRTSNAATVDVGWAVLVVGGAVGAAVAGEGDPARRAVVAGLAAVWALRLAAYLVRDRVLRPGPEDGRYRALRERWGARAPVRFLAVYLVQVPVAALFVVPVAASMRAGPPDAWLAAGVAVGLAAAFGESVADRQLARFRAAPEHAGRVCRAGLWRYSRHPNYFFEWLHWWAYVVIGHAHPLTFLGPAAMLVFLFRITGIPYAERQALRSRGDAYRAYQRATSVFVPWPPREAGR